MREQAAYGVINNFRVLCYLSAPKKEGKRRINGIVGSVEKREKREMEREKGFPFSLERRTGAIRS